MSATPNPPHGTMSHGHQSHGGQKHGTLRDYLIGFALSVVLTAVPFWLVMSGVLQNNQLTAFVVMALAMVQIVVHIVYFLHVSSGSDEGWGLMALIFTLVVIVITLAGSLWVMHHLNTNTMPFHEMQQMP